MSFRVFRGGSLPVSLEILRLRDETTNNTKKRENIIPAKRMLEYPQWVQKLLRIVIAVLGCWMRPLAVLLKRLKDVLAIVVAGKAVLSALSEPPIGRLHELALLGIDSQNPGVGRPASRQVRIKMLVEIALVSPGSFL